MAPRSTTRTTRTAARGAAPRAAVAPPAPAPTLVTETPVVVGPELKKKELVDRVVARSGLRKRDVKPAVEAMLEVLGEALAAGEELNLPPLGKLKVTRAKEVANARILHCRLRQPERGGDAGPDPLAEDGEEG